MTFYNNSDLTYNFTSTKSRQQFKIKKEKFTLNYNYEDYIFKSNITLLIEKEISKGNNSFIIYGQIGVGKTKYVNFLKLWICIVFKISKSILLSFKEYKTISCIVKILAYKVLQKNEIKVFNKKQFSEKLLYLKKKFNEEKILLIIEDIEYYYISNMIIDKYNKFKFFTKNNRNENRRKENEDKLFFNWLLDTAIETNSIVILTTSSFLYKNMSLLKEFKFINIEGSNNDLITERALLCKFYMEKEGINYNKNILRLIRLFENNPLGYKLFIPYLKKYNADVIELLLLLGFNFKNTLLPFKRNPLHKRFEEVLFINKNENLLLSILSFTNVYDNKYLKEFLKNIFGNDIRASYIVYNHLKKKEKDLMLSGIIIDIHKKYNLKFLHPLFMYYLKAKLNNYKSIKDINKKNTVRKDYITMENVFVETIENLSEHYYKYISNGLLGNDISLIIEFPYVLLNAIKLGYLNNQKIISTLILFNLKFSEDLQPEISKEFYEILYNEIFEQKLYSVNLSEYNLIKAITDLMFYYKENELKKKNIKNYIEPFFEIDIYSIQNNELITIMRMLISNLSFLDITKLKKFIIRVIYNNNYKINKNNKIIFGLINYIEAEIYLIEDRIEEASIKINNSFRLLKEKNYINNIISIYQKLGMFLMHEKKYIEAYSKFKTYYNLTNNRLSKNIIKLEMIKCLLLLKRYEEALIELKRCYIYFYNNTEGNLVYIDKIFKYLIDEFIGKFEYTKALNYIEERLKFAKKHNFKESVGSCYISGAYCCLNSRNQLKKENTEENYLLNAINFYKKDIDWVKAIIIELSKIYLKTENSLITERLTDIFESDTNKIEELLRKLQINFYCWKDFKNKKDIQLDEYIKI